MFSHHLIDVLRQQPAHHTKESTDADHQKKGHDRLNVLAPLGPIPFNAQTHRAARSESGIAVCTHAERRCVREREAWCPIPYLDDDIARLVNKGEAEYFGGAISTKSAHVAEGDPCGGAACVGA